MGADTLTIGGLYSIVTATMIVLRPAVGFGLDYFGRKHVFVTALVFTAIAMSAFAFARSLSELYLARSLQGIAGTIMGVSVNTIVADLTRRCRSRARDGERQRTRRREAASSGNLSASP